MTSEDLEGLRRWEDAGGTWELVRSGAGVVELDLLTCGGGEIMEHLRSHELDLVEYVLEQEADG